jgi:hypothetical protein
MANVNNYGFIGLADLYNQRISGINGGVQWVWDAIRLSVDEYNRVAGAVLGEFAQTTEMAMEQIELPGDGTLQPLDDNGNPLPVLPSGNYQVAYPIQGAGTAWGDDRVSRELMTVEEADRFTSDSLRRDANWIVRHALAAILTNTTWVFNDKSGGAFGVKGLGDITIQPLANNDTVKYTRKGIAVSAIDDHYLAQAAAIADGANPFPTIKAELHEHPSNMNLPIVAYVASDLVSSIQGLTEFVDKDDPDIRAGNASDTLSGMISAGPGDTVLGKTKSGVWVVEWGAMPSNYLVAKVLGRQPLKMREYPAPNLKGLFPERADIDGNHIVKRFIRYAGFGTADRVAALAMYIGGAAYAIPANYSAPLPA